MIRGTSSAHGARLSHGRATLQARMRTLTNGRASRKAVCTMARRDQTRKGARAQMTSHVGALRSVGQAPCNSQAMPRGSGAGNTHARVPEWHVERTCANGPPTPRAQVGIRSSTTRHRHVRRGTWARNQCPAATCLNTRQGATQCANTKYAGTRLRDAPRGA